MSVTVVVFEEHAAPKNEDLSTWLRNRHAAESKGDWKNSKTSSNALNSWFNEMRDRFPPLVEARPDDSRGTDYSFYEHFVRVELAGSVSKEGVFTAWKIASELGLRILVGDELLPRFAPQDTKLIRIIALDGGGDRAGSVVAANVIVAIVDPTIAPASDTKRWVYDQLNAAHGTADPSILESDRLRQWNDEFGALGLAETIIFKNFILLRLQTADLDAITATAIKLANRFRLGVSIFED